MKNKERLVAFIKENLEKLNENTLQKIADTVEEETYAEEYKDHI